jgi:NADH-quinone oxidoreductase subunit L
VVDSTALLWIILCAPLVACVIITVWTVPSPKLSAGVALMGMLTSCVSTATLWYRHGTRGTLPFESSINWISFPDLHIEFGLLLDPLSFVMLTVVTGVGTLIFLYASGYMQGDPGYSRFFASLSMFAFSMLGIVLSNNWISLFIFWELVV